MNALRAGSGRQIKEELGAALMGQIVAHGNAAGQGWATVTSDLSPATYLSASTYA